MQTVLTDGDGPLPRWRTWLQEMWREKGSVRDLYDLRHWSERTVIALVMQTVDNSITTFSKRSRLTRRWYLSLAPGARPPNPTWIPVANKAVRMMAQVIGGKPGGSIGELFNRPLTAHFIGGRTIGESDGTGVIDPYQRVFHYRGCTWRTDRRSRRTRREPSLTITAQAERAMAFWPNKGEPDPRPALGEGHARLDPAAPSARRRPRPLAALRLPIVGVSSTHPPPSRVGL